MRNDKKEHLIRNRQQMRIYISFVIIAGIVCIFMAEVAGRGRLSEWIYNLSGKDVVNKAIEGGRGDSSPMVTGTIMTKYRFQEFGESNPNDIDTGAPMIALTFDDGPHQENTKRILDVLTANYSHATFFLVGTNAAKYPETVRAIAAAGCEIGNHSENHKDLTKLSDSELYQQIDGVNRTVKAATGEQTTVIRPPYGAFDDRVLGMLSEPVVLWDLDTEDWDSRNAQTVVENVMNHVKDGDIVLMHDIYESTAEAVEILVPRLKEQGFLIVSVSEMAQYKGKQLELNKPYGKIAGEQE